MLFFLFSVMFRAAKFAKREHIYETGNKEIYCLSISIFPKIVLKYLEQ